MSRYALDLNRRELVVSWGTGIGDAAQVVAALPAGISDRNAFALARAATSLAAVAWRTYTHPQDAAHDGLDSESPRRERDALAGVLAAVHNPNLPEGGSVLQSYIPGEEASHRLGRALHIIGDPALTSTIADDIASELDAIERAQRGDLTGRARQAVTLTRADASPVQITAADALLRGEPLGGTELFTETEPTAAAIAAAHWLHAAATVVADRSGDEIASIVVEADNIEALPHESPTAVLEMIEQGQSPRVAVIELISDALAVADGRTPNIEALIDEIEVAEAQAETEALRQGEEVRQALLPTRLTPLDPRRPAIDLLEDLLYGIHGCWLLYGEYVDVDAGDRGSDGEDDDSDEYYERRRNALTEKFYDEVRT